MFDFHHMSRAPWWYHILQAKGLLSEYQPKYNSARAVYRERKKYVDEIDWNLLAVPPSGSPKAPSSPFPSLYYAFVFIISLPLPHRKGSLPFLVSLEEGLCLPLFTNYTLLLFGPSHLTIRPSSLFFEVETLLLWGYIWKSKCFNSFLKFGDLV